MASRILIFLLSIISMTTAFASSHVIPFKLVDKLIVVKATVGGKEGNFILDTGIPYMLLNSNYYDGKPSNMIHNGILGTSEEMEIAFPQVRMGDIIWKSEYAGIVSLEHLAKSLKTPLHGLLGCNLFDRYEIMVDYNTETIMLWDLSKKGDRKDLTVWEQPPPLTIELDYSNNVPSLQTSLGDQVLHFILDTGAEINLIDNKLNADFREKMEGVGNSSLGGISQHIETRGVTLLYDMVIESQTLLPMRTAFINMDFINRRQLRSQIHGILGYEFLNQYTFAINPKKCELYLWPNPTTKEIAEASND